MTSPDDISWVKRINGRWIVRKQLRKSAADYLDHLAEKDPERLLLSCHRARTLTERYGNDEDPKPWFYASLFSLATDEEGDRFLADHDFTHAAIPGLSCDVSVDLRAGWVAEETQEKLRRIRKALKNQTMSEAGW